MFRRPTLSQVILLVAFAVAVFAGVYGVLQAARLGRLEKALFGVKQDMTQSDQAASDTVKPGGWSAADRGRVATTVGRGAGRHQTTARSVRRSRPAGVAVGQYTHRSGDSPRGSISLLPRRIHRLRCAVVLVASMDVYGNRCMGAQWFA